MSASLEIRTITLRVADLARSLGFFAGKLGFVVRQQDKTRAELATTPAEPPLLTLEESRTASPVARDAAGLFHAALLFPTRAALGGWLQRAAERGVAFDGFSDHRVSEAIYFSDPDGNGLEFYADRPRDMWPIRNGQVEMDTQPLDLPSLLGAAKPGQPILAGARWGHLHLRVTDLEESEGFYTRELGLDVMQRTYPGASFLGADGYHHHLGLNVWGHPRHPQPPSALGLASATFSTPTHAEPAERRDPNGILLRLEPLQRG